MTIPATDKWKESPDNRSLTLTGLDPGQIGALIAKSRKTRGGFLSFDINLPKRPRSTGPGSANHHLNGHAQQLSMAMGVPFETAKMYIKIRAAIEMGYPAETIKGVTLPQSEALASVEECIMLIEMAHIIASEIPVSLIEEPGND